MPVQTRFESVRLYGIGDGMSIKMASLTQDLGSRHLVVVDGHCTRELQARIASGFDAVDASCQFLRFPCKLCTRDSAKELSEQIMRISPDVVVAAGGGKCLDVVRASLRYFDAATRPKIVLLPTILTTNASVNGTSVMYGEDGRVGEFWTMPGLPDAVLVDSGLIACASSRFLAAAIGDQIASSLEAIHAIEYRGCGAADALGFSHHRTALDVLRRNAVGAVASAEERRVTSKLEIVCEAVSYYTGPQQATSRACLAHVLDEAFLVFPSIRDRMHGEVVAFFALAELVATGHRDELEGWIELYTQIGLPVTLGQLGIGGLAMDDAVAACRAGANGVIARGASQRWTAEQKTEFVFQTDSLVRSIVGRSRP